MKNKFLLFLLVVLLLFFVSCRKTENIGVEGEDSDSPDWEEQVQTVTVCGVEVQWNGYSAIEPDSYLDIWNMDFSDFGAFFEEQYEVELSSYKLMEGELTETQVVHIHSEKEGPTIYVVGAVHGDEKAAWYTAILLKKVTLKSGDLYVLAPANANGAKNDSRYVTEKQDLNRVFPGDPEGNEAQRLAASIYSDIEDKQPDLVLDLHEAIIYNNSRDFLGSTYIFTDLSVFAKKYDLDLMFLDLLLATEEGTICHNTFGSTGPGPAGSINATVTNELEIPVITVETFRGFDIYRRVYDQLDTVQFILEYLDMR